MAAKARIYIWDDAVETLSPEDIWVGETTDPQILNLIRDLFSGKHWSYMQKPLVTRLDPIN